MISPSTIEQVTDLDIIHVLEKFDTKLTKKGTTHWACCPWHTDKTPSFSASFARQSFKCFSCGEHGSGVDFVMKNNKLEFIEAIKEIAEAFNIHIEHDSSEQAEKAAKQAAKRKELADIAKEAYKFLKSQQPKNCAVAEFEALEPIIDDFDLMLGGSGWSDLTNHLIKQNIDLTEAAKLKLITKVTKGKNAGNYIDVLRNCLIFPLHSERGTIIGFAKRHLLPEDVEKYGKYHNPAESDLYQKRETLYGIHQAREHMEGTGICNLVEGYTDVTSMHLAWHKNTVGTCGTALTKEQARLIAKYAKHVNIMRDGDAAGQKAANRDIDILLAAGLTCSLVFLPEKEDPDSLILKNWAA